MKETSVSTQPSTRKTSSDSWIEVTNMKIPALKPWIQSDIENGLKSLSKFQQNSSLFDRISRTNNLQMLMTYIISDFEGSNYSKKALKLLINMLRMKPKTVIFELEKAKVLIEYLPQLVELDRHGLYLSLKLITCLLKTDPKFLKNLHFLVLRRIGKKISFIFNTQQHKKLLKLTIKVLNLLPGPQKITLATCILDIERDFPNQHLSQEIEEIIDIVPFAFLDKFVNFLANSTPEQIILRHLGKLLHSLMKSPRVAGDYYKKGLDKFFDGVLKSVNFFWCNTRFILVFIADFPFVWRNLRFRKEFIEKFVKYIDENPHHLTFIEDKLEVIDQFLMTNHIKNNLKFARSIKEVKNQNYVKRKIIINSKKIKENILTLREFNVIGRFLLKKIQKMSLKITHQSGIFLSEIEHRHLLQNIKESNSQFFMAIGSQLNNKDFTLLGNHRNKKLLKVSKIGKTNLKTPNFSKTRVKKLQLKNGQYPLRVAFSLKREGFEAAQFNFDDLLTTTSEGNSTIRLIEILPDYGRGSNLSPTNLKFYNQSQNKKCFEILFEKTFDFKIIDFTFIENFIHFWGHSVYGILEIKAKNVKCEYGPIVKNTMKKFRKIETEIILLKNLIIVLLKNWFLLIMST